MNICELQYGNHKCYLFFVTTRPCR